MLAETFASNINWTLIFTALMAVTSAGMWWDARRQKPAPTQLEQPVQIQKVFPAVTVAEMRDAIAKTNERIDRQQEQIDKINEIIRVEIPQMERNITAAGEQRVVKLHDRLNEVLAEVSRLEGRIDEALKHS